MTKNAIVIPVGPDEAHARYLEECLASVEAQERPPDFVIIVDDMHGGLDEFMTYEPPRQIYRPPWRLGVGGAFNAGVALAHARGADLAFMLGADDTIEPGCLRQLETVYGERGGRDGFYWFDVRYSDGRLQSTPCNFAAVTPDLWRAIGGFPPESGVGAMDSMFVSVMLKHYGMRDMPHVAGGPYCIVRVHDEQETAKATGLQAAIHQVRNWLTINHRPTRWGRYE